MTITAILTRKSVLKFFGVRLDGENVEMDSLEDVKKILYGNDTVAIQELISSENEFLCPNLRLICNNLSGKDDKERRREINKQFMECLIQLKSSPPLAFVWLKKHMDFEVCDTIISDYNYVGSFLQLAKDLFFGLIETVQNTLTNCVADTAIALTLKITYNAVFKIIMVSIAYLDLTLDSILLSAILSVLGSTLTNMSLFSSQIAFLLFISIIIPGLMTAVSIAYKRPFVILSLDNWIKWKQSSANSDSDGKKTLLILRILIVVLFPIVPALILLAQYETEEKRKALRDKENGQDPPTDENSDLSKSELITSYLNETRLALLTFKRNELSIELVFQLSIHVTMVLLSQTNYPLESGLQSIFKSSKSETQGTLAFLVLSILWSFKTTAITSIAIKADSKKFLPIVPKLILGMRYLFIFLVRIGCIVGYFSPFIGLLGIMDHYQAETIPLNYETFKRLNGTYHYWNPLDQKIDSVRVEELFRSDYSNTKHPGLPSITHYTGVKLGMAFTLFWMFYLVYAILLTMIKCCISPKFRNSKSHWERLQHIVEVLNVPETFGDWDSYNGEHLETHFKNWKKTLLEMLVMGLMQLISNMILLVPFFIMGEFNLIYRTGTIINRSLIITALV